jgi:hypothetical protein
MSNENSASDNLSSPDFERPTLPSGLNILTILSMIWSVIQLLLGIYGYFSSEKSYNEKDKVLEQLNSPDAPGWLKSVMGDPAQFEMTITRSYENRLPILLLTLVAATLCFIGAMQMRQLKKQGFLLYVIGELLPFITMVLFIGAFMLTNTANIVFLAIAAFFILMYSLNRKYLVY